jgi:hypothetical protein
MESEIGNPVTYQPEPLKPIDARQDAPPPPAEEESSPIEDFYYDEPQHHHHMMYPPQFMPPEEKKFDFTSLDKMTMILLFTAFILGFFMGKTQTIQPMILRYS